MARIHASIRLAYAPIARVDDLVEHATVSLTPKLVRESREGAGRLIHVPLGEAESQAQIDHESQVVGDGAEVNRQRGLEAQLAAELPGAPLGDHLEPLPSRRLDLGSR